MQQPIIRPWMRFYGNRGRKISKLDKRFQKIVKILAHKMVTKSNYEMPLTSPNFKHRQFKTLHTKT